MNRKIFTLLMVLALTMTGALLAQSTGTTAGSQQVDPSGQAEQPGLPDVDVDTGANAQGAVDVDVDARGDADTAASSTNDDTTTTGAYDAAGDTGSLPDTASKTPLLGLVGLLSLGLAFTLRAIR